jgi:two-component system, OmpR family, response regulator ResD
VAGGWLVTTALRALVIDDDIAIRRLVARILERRGFIVETARDGAEGIERLAAVEYHVIVLDLMMPRVNGAGVLKYLGEYHPAQLAAVIVMSAFGATAAQLSPTPAAFLAKPFDIAALVHEVGECVRRSAHATSRIAPDHA